MAEVILKNIKKVYPYVSGEKKKRGKKGSEPEKKKVNLQITDEGRDVILIVPTVDMKNIPAMGDTIHFSFNGNVAHVFSKETDKNLEY